MLKEKMKKAKKNMTNEKKKEEIHSFVFKLLKREKKLVDKHNFFLFYLKAFVK